MGILRGSLILVILIFAFIKHRSVLHKDSTEQNDMQRGKIWRFSHPTGCMLEYGESHCSATKQHETLNFFDFS